jgi:hypothetical protein
MWAAASGFILSRHKATRERSLAAPPEIAKYLRDDLETSGLAVA